MLIAWDDPSLYLQMMIPRSSFTSTTSPSCFALITKSEDKSNLMASSAPLDINTGDECLTGITCFDCFRLYSYRVVTSIQFFYELPYVAIGY